MGLVGKVRKKSPEEGGREGREKTEMPLGLCQKKGNNHKCLVTGARGSTSLWVWEKAEEFHRMYSKLELILG